MGMLQKVREIIVNAGGDWDLITVDFTGQLLAYSLGADISVFTDDLLPLISLYGLSAADVVNIAALTEPTIDPLIIEQVSGEFLLDPNEINSGTIQGTNDERLNGDLGNVGATNLTRTTAGYVFPFAVKLVGFTAHHTNSAVGNNSWGWVFYSLSRTAGANTVSTTFLRDESFNRGDGFFGLRDYANNINQSTFLGEADFVDTVIPAGDIVFVGVGAPTADTTNNYVRVNSGCMVFERV